MRTSGKKDALRKIALERIKKLFDEAAKNPEKASRYVELARRIAMKVEMSLPRMYKRCFCTFCYTYFQPGNTRVRVKDKVLITYCLTCKRFNKMRFR